MSKFGKPQTAGWHPGRYHYQKPTYKKEIRTTIIDSVGNDVEPGTIIAYPSGAELSFAVYECVVEHYYKDSDSLKSTRVQVCSYTSDGLRRSSIGKVSRNLSELQSNIVVIKNPLYSVINTSIGHCLEAIQALKDEGVLDKDFSPR